MLRDVRQRIGAFIPKTCSIGCAADAEAVENQENGAGIDVTLLHCHPGASRDDGILFSCSDASMNDGRAHRFVAEHIGLSNDLRSLGKGVLVSGMHETERR